MSSRMLLVAGLTGLLGLGPVAPVDAQAPEAALTGATQVAAGGHHSCARLANGTVTCWGTNYDGEAGNGTNGQDVMPPTTVSAVVGAGPLTGVRQVDVGYYHSCALLNSGQVRCWGYNGQGQVGNGSPADQILRAKIVSNPAGTGPLAGVTQIALGERHSCARLSNGQARCWGENAWGEIGDGTTGTARTRPRAVRNVADTGPLTGVTQLDAGESSTCARLANGQARCWGQNGSLQLGNGVSSPSDLPVPVETAPGVRLQDVTQITVDTTHGCARLANSRVRCWGSNSDGQIGDGSTTPRPRATTVLNVAGGAPLSGVTRIDAGGSHTCARLGNGQARCWGRGNQGQLGWDALSGNLLPRIVVNLQANGPLLNVRQIRTGALHTCALLANGQLRCWGHNDNGQVGDGTDSTDRDRPRVVIA